MIAMLGTLIGIFGSGPGGFGVPNEVLFHKVYNQTASGMGTRPDHICAKHCCY